jgi:intracellular sulfur oxidation DsrE/DsrF family protein
MIALVALLMVTATGAIAQSASDYGKQKVVYHINYDGGADDAAYRAAMQNVQNHINSVGAENLDIKVVLHGNGLGLLMQAKQNERLQSQIASLKGQNVGFQVCDNTLKGREISYADDLYDVWEEDIVPSGVAELSRLQQMGYTYIKP